MRILMLSWEYPPRIVGGISRVVYDLAQNLGEKGNEIHIVTCWEPGTRDFERDKNVLVHRVHTYSINTDNFINWVLHLNFALLECAIKIFNEYGLFDIIHAHDWIVAFTARVLKHSYSVPLVSTIHATEYGRNQGIHNSVNEYISGVEWWLTYESWRVIVNSRYMKDEVVNIFQLPLDKIRVIPNGVNLEKFKGYERDNTFRRKFASDTEKIVFFVGRLVNEKGAHILLDAVPKVLSHYHNVKFVITGKGPQMDFLRSKAENMGISSKVYFTGYLDDGSLHRLFKCADIAVFPSLYEPFGIVALEGMLANVPVIVSDIGGLDEIVNHGEDGMKFYVGNANSLADCILELLFNPQKAERIKEKAMKKVNKIYNWDIISRQTMDVYKEVAEECGKTGWGR